METKDIVREKILKLFAEEGKPDTYYQNLFGYKHSTISKWKTKQSSSFMDKLPEIADYFNVPVSYLLGTSEPIPADTRSIPIIGSVACGMPIQVYEIDMGTVEVPEAYAPYASDLYAFRASGDSMYPVIMDGDILICKRNPESRIVNNKIYIFENSDGEATIKKVHTDNAGLILIPLNPAHAIITYTKEQVKASGIRPTYELLQMVRSF